ncbi:unnamed protein product, partial [Polarella glacialis]
GSNRIDELFGFSMKSTLKCLECDEEPTQESVELNRVMMCHLGTQTEPVSHIHQGVTLSLKEHIEKSSPVLGRNAQYEKTSSLNSLPPYLVVQFARFGYKGANEWAGTSASKVKLIRKIAFSHTFDVFDCASDDLKKKLSVGRVRKKEQEDIEMERAKAALSREKNKEQGSSLEPQQSTTKTQRLLLLAPSACVKVDMTPAEDAGPYGVDMKSASGVEELDTGTGYYQLIGIVSHKGRTADGGHYVGWTLHKKASGDMASISQP